MKDELFTIIPEQGLTSGTDGGELIGRSAGSHEVSPASLVEAKQQMENFMETIQSRVKKEGLTPVGFLYFKDGQVGFQHTFFFLNEQIFQSSLSLLNNTYEKITADIKTPEGRKASRMESYANAKKLNATVALSAESIEEFKEIYRELKEQGVKAVISLSPELRAKYSDDALKRIAEDINKF